MLTPFSILVLLGLSTASNDPPGHMQRLGSHRPPIEIEELDSMIDPVQFFNEYMKPGKPVIFRGAAKLAPNFELWKDDEYLKKNFGKWFLSVEVGKYEGAIFGGKEEMPFSEYVDSYKDKNYYVISALMPDNPMTREVPLYKPISCGGYEEHIHLIMLLFSGGGTDSALHIDGGENFHCTLDGTKDWVFFHRKHGRFLPPMKGESAYSEVNALKVDMYKYPMMRHLPWYHAFLEAGDCLYVPYGWYHQVKSSNTRNMALAFWMHNMHKLSHMESCPKNLTELENFRGIKNYAYSQHIVTRSTLWAMFVENPDLIPEKDFVRFCVVRGEQEEDRCKKAFRLIDTDNDGYIIEEEVENMSEEAIYADIFQKREPMAFISVDDVLYEPSQDSGKDEL